MMVLRYCIALIAVLGLLVASAQAQVGGGRSTAMRAMQ